VLPGTGKRRQFREELAGQRYFVGQFAQDHGGQLRLRRAKPHRKNASSEKNTRASSTSWASSSFARPVLPQSGTGKIQRENTRDGSQFPFTGSPLLRSIVPD